MMSRLVKKSHSIYLRIVITLALVSLIQLSVLFGSDGPRAFDWRNDLGVNASVGYDDNYRLTENNEVETSSRSAGFTFSTTGNTEISSISFAVGANANSYSDSSVDGNESYRLSLDSTRRGERLTGSLAIVFDSQSTTETELLDTGVTEDGTRDDLFVSPSMRYQVDERNTMSASLSARDVSYDTDSLTEFKENAASISWRYQLSEADNVSLSLRASEYDPEDDRTTDVTSLTLGYGSNIDEATSYNLGIGYSDVDRPSDSETGGNYSIAVSHTKDERNNFTFSFDHGYQSSGDGEVREEDRLSLQWNHGLSERSGLFLGSEAVSYDDRDYYSVSFGGRYQYSPDLSLSSNLRYRRQEGDTEDADGFSVFLSLSYSVI